VTFVALASDQHPAYQFFVPLSAAVWMRRVSPWKPIVILVGSELEWWGKSTSLTVLGMLEQLKITPHFVECPAGSRSANVAQIARMYAAYTFGMEDDDVIVTSDIDMWPVDGSWFTHHLPVARQVTSYYGNFPSRFPMCYVAADVATWREMHGYQRGCALGDVVEMHMLKHLRPETAAPDAWQHDEEYLTARIHALGPDRLKKVIRPSGDPFPDRIDRVCWPHELELGGKRDAHLLRPGSDLPNWGRLRTLLHKLCPDLVGWADEYAAVYRSLAG
jgi:hypothetical protein